MTKLDQTRQARFAAQVDSWTLAAVADHPMTFASVLGALPGVYPTVLLESLRRLAAAGRIPEAVAGTLELEARTPDTANGRPSFALKLPIPHPLDFEWRFSIDACNTLLDAIADFSSPEDIAALIGTPGLCAYALTRNIGRQMIFVGEDNVVTDELRRLNAHTSGQVEIISCKARPAVRDASVIVIDPPWYFDYIRPLMQMAAQACRIGGHVLISMPPLGTRPTAEEDREAIIRYARRLGLRQVSKETASLPYDTPFFEWNALASVGVRNIPPTWRRGDLEVFKCVRRPSPLPAWPSTSRADWREAAVDGVRIRSRNDAEVNGIDARLVPVAEGAILSSVSRRDPRRKFATVWTSGNRAFRCNRPDLAHMACLSLAASDSKPEFSRKAVAAPYSVKEIDEIERLRVEISGIVAQEKAELDRFEWGDVLTCWPLEGSKLTTSSSAWSMSNIGGTI